MQALDDLAPYGGLANVHLELGLPAGQKPGFLLRAQLVDVSASPWKNAPGIRNAGGYLEMGPAAGFVDIDNGAVTLEFPKVYDDDLNFDSARGHVSWRRDANGVRVAGDLIHLHLK